MIEFPKGPSILLELLRSRDSINNRNKFQFVRQDPVNSYYCAIGKQEKLQEVKISRRN